MIFTIIMFYILPYYILKQAIIGKNKIKFFKGILLILLFIAYLIFSNKILYFFKERDYRFFTFYLLTSQMMEYLGKKIFNLGLISIFLSAILSGYGTTHCILNYLIYPYFISIYHLMLETIDLKLQNFKEKKKTIDIKLVRKKSEIFMHKTNSSNSDSKNEISEKNYASDVTTSESNKKENELIKEVKEDKVKEEEKMTLLNLVYFILI